MSANEYEIEFQRDGDAEPFAVLPGELISRLGTDIVLAFATRCLRIYTAEEWAPLLERYQSLPPLARSGLTVLFANAAECDLTGGRLSVPSKLLEFAGIEKKAEIVFGSIDPQHILSDGCYLRRKDV